MRFWESYPDGEGKPSLFAYRFAYHFLILFGTD